MRMPPQQSARTAASASESASAHDRRSTRSTLTSSSCSIRTRARKDPTRSAFSTHRGKRVRSRNRTRRRYSSRRCRNSSDLPGSRSSDDLPGSRSSERPRSSSNTFLKLVCSNMKLRTIKNYKAHVQAARSKGTSPLAALSKRLSKGISKSPRRYALEISFERLQEAIPGLLQTNPRVAAVASAMVLTGLRFSDLCFLERRFIKIKWSVEPEGFIVSIDVRRAKNIMKDICRRRLVIPVSFTSHLHDFFFPLLDWYSSATPLETLAVGTVSEFNKYLSLIDTSDYAETENARRFYTSYSLRRFAFKNFIAQCVDGLGIIDWDKACRFSLHMKENTLQAFYHGDLMDEDGGN